MLFYRKTLLRRPSGGVWVFVCGWVFGCVGERCKKERERVSERRKRRATSKLDASGTGREMVKERRENVHSLSNEVFPLAALRNPGYQVPPHLLEMAEEENRRLQQRRYSRVRAHTHTLYFVIFC